MFLFTNFAILQKKYIFLIFIASTTNQNPIWKANMMFLSKEATNKDQNLKMQMMLSLNKASSSNSDKIWGFYNRKTKFPRKYVSVL